MQTASIAEVDAIVVMYSITDRKSFHVASDILEDLADPGVHPVGVSCPILLLANKTDLGSHRKVSASLLSMAQIFMKMSAFTSFLEWLICFKC